MARFVLAAAATVAFAQLGPILTPDPIIGILTVPLSGAEEPCVTISRRAGVAAAFGSSSSPSCFTAFYPKWIEGAGARAVFIPYNADAATLRAILGSVNGVLFTGGGLPLQFGTPYVDTALSIFNAVQDMNDAGDYFPLHGTCMGMQLLSILAARNASVLALNAFNSENLSLPLDFTRDGVANSRIFSAAPQDVVDIFATQNVTENLHHDGVPPSAYASNGNLSSFFKLISTNMDRNGSEFISTLEAWKYPITATQFHPERFYEHRPGIGLVHSFNATRALQYIANYLVDEARRNGHSFTNATLLDTLAVYGYVPISEGPLMDGYQAYIVDL